MSDQLTHEQVMEIWQKVIESPSLGKTYSQSEYLHAFANKIREQTVLDCLEIVKQNTYEPDAYDRNYDYQNAAYRKSEELYDDIKSHFKIKTAAPRKMNDVCSE